MAHTWSKTEKRILYVVGAVILILMLAILIVLAGGIHVMGYQQLQKKVVADYEENQPDAVGGNECEEVAVTDPIPGPTTSLAPVRLRLLINNYKIVSRSNALTFCRRLKMSLVSIDNQQVSDKLSAILIGKEDEYWTSGRSTNYGLKFSWSTGKEFDESLWHMEGAHSMTNISTTCLALRRQGRKLKSTRRAIPAAHHLIATSCNRKLGFICIKSNPGV